ncbi:MAG: sensor histidine kinase [Lachnospiraceae bacterium]|nr:sensor histidine kinase [Lachnospiraceae bacterium]
MALFIYVLADILHLVKVAVLCNMFFAFHQRQVEHKKIWLTLLGCAVCGISTFIYLYDNEVLETILYIIILVILSFLLYEEKIYDVLKALVWAVLALSMIDTMIAVLYDVSMDLLGTDGRIFKNICVSVVSLSLVYVVGRTYKKNAASGMNSIGIFNLFLFTLLLLADTLVVTVVEFMNTELNLTRNRNIYLLAVVFVIIGIFIQLAAVILLFTQRNVYKEKEAITDKYLNEQKSHYEYLENREKETRKFRHDLRSHMETISHMAINHEYEGINSYLEKIHMKIDTFGNLVTVQNGIVDAIINQYYAKAKQNDVKMDVRGRLPADCAIDAFDLCTIFSNILSNAYEAAITTEEKYISLECRYNDKNIIIVVKNSFDSTSHNNNNQWKTRKEDTDYHGYGLENIKDSVKKYNGIFDIDVQAGLFVLTILFNNSI